MKPYYERDGITIYHGDARDVLPCVEADVLVTDPPFGIAFKSGWTGSSIQGDEDTEVRDCVLGWWRPRPALVFASASQEVPDDAKATLIWHRPGSGMGDLAFPWKPDYEFIHVYGEGFCSTERGTSVLTEAWDMFRGDAYHPHQKPAPLLRRLIRNCPPGIILDPFMGSGTTLRAAKDLGRKAIGIEIEERYCEIAAKRLSQEVLL